MAKRGRKPKDGETKTPAQRTKEWRLRKFGEPSPKAPAKTGAERARESYERRKQRTARYNFSEGMRQNRLIMEPFLEEPLHRIMKNIANKLGAMGDEDMPIEEIRRLLRKWYRIQLILSLRDDLNETTRKMLQSRKPELWVSLEVRFPRLDRINDSS
jgi:hypothetical protein